MKPKDLKNSLPILLYIILENENSVDEIAVNKSNFYDYSGSKGNYAANKSEALKLLFGALIILTTLISFIVLLVMIAIF